MARDRGTMQRGLPPAPEEHAAWPQPTAPAGRRVPSAPRERKPALAALALLLIVGGALGAGFLVLSSGRRVAAIEISQQVGAGQQLPLTAMQQVQVAADSGIHYVPWSQASQVARYYAATTIPPGTLLSSAMVVQASGATRGKDVLGLALKDGQWPAQLTVGDHVAIVAVGGQGGSNAGCPGAGGNVLASEASVLDVNAASASGLVGASQNGTTDVTVAVSPADAGKVACSAAAGNVAVVVLPPGGQPPAAGPPSPAPSASPASRKLPAGSGEPPASQPAAAPPGHG